MIQDILTEQKTPDQKPRFFLHDEMKAWLSENLEVRVRIAPNHVSDYQVMNALHKVNIYNHLVGGISIETSAYIAGQPITGNHGCTVPLTGNTEAIYTLLQTTDHYDQLVKHMANQIDQLRKRIEMLENPLPV